MYIDILRYIFGFSGLIFAFLLSILTFYHSPKLSKYVPLIAGLLILYCLTAILLVFFAPNNLYRLILLIFGLSPFIIGRMVSYEKLKKYSFIQTLCVILSVMFVTIFWI